MVHMKGHTVSKNKTKNKWTAEERQAFADGNRLKAQTVKKREEARTACRLGRWD